MELVDGDRSKGVSNVCAVKGDPYGSNVLRSVVGDVGEVEPGNGLPRGRVEDLRNHSSSGGGGTGDTVVTHGRPHSQWMA